ncbi:MAG: SDR family NAD(P)-dependent oxidoreductase, partial [Deltaproteobacteria bacterium]|nr:SDR family NAD(P)-dependent oxidoreductase [Deltaproteobacteria bacterium]
MIGTVVITGASAGIGAACARKFAALKAPLVLGARRMDRLEAVAKECRDLGSPLVLVHTLDVREKDSIAAFAAFAEPHTPEILLNNAGLALGRDPLVQLKDEDLTGMIDTNVTGFL